MIIGTFCRHVQLVGDKKQSGANGVHRSAALVGQELHAKEHVVVKARFGRPRASRQPPVASVGTKTEEPRWAVHPRAPYMVVSPRI